MIVIGIFEVLNDNNGLVVVEVGDFCNFCVGFWREIGRDIIIMWVY